MTDSDPPHPRLGGPDAEERPTLKTIARLSGLAVPTVSRALNDAPDIGEETKRRVKEIAHQIGYRPNRAGVRLRTGKTNVICLVLSTEHDIMNHTAKLIYSIAATLRGTPYHLIVTPYFPDEDPLTPIKYIVETGSADGIIINQTQPEDPRIRYLMEHDFPFVTHGRSNWCASHAYVDFDNIAFGAIAVETLTRRGRRNIRMLAPPMQQNYAQNMVAGASAAAIAHGAAFSLMQGASADSTSPAIEASVLHALRQMPRPDAFIVPSASACMALVAAVEDAGLVLGRDFDALGKEASPFLSRFRREMLTMREDVSRAGTFAARAVMHRINHRAEPPMQELDVPVMDQP